MYAQEPVSARTASRSVAPNCQTRLKRHGTLVQPRLLLAFCQPTYLHVRHLYASRAGSVRHFSFSGAVTLRDGAREAVNMHVRPPCESAVCCLSTCWQFVLCAATVML